MPRPRITLRWPMLAVAIAAIMLAGLMARSRQLQAVASYHRARVIQSYEEPTVRGPDAYGSDSQGRQVTIRFSDWHQAMSAHYQHIAERPWLPVGPEPPWRDRSYYNRSRRVLPGLGTALQGSSESGPHPSKAR